jgi:DNA-binding response OmpR family regulator
VPPTHPAESRIQGLRAGADDYLMSAIETDVLLCDIGFPDGNGWELLRKVKLPKSVYTIAMSGYGMGSDKNKSMDSGYKHHLLKPFELEELDSILERVP